MAYQPTPDPVFPAPAARFKRFAALIRWVKGHPIVGALGVVASILGVVKGLPAAEDASTQMLGIPRCIFYADTYSHAGGDFIRSGSRWVENPPYDGQNHFVFSEVKRDRDYIYLLDQTPARRNGKQMRLRLPACGGPAQWTYENPDQWTDVYQVWKH